MNTVETTPADLAFIVTAPNNLFPTEEEFEQFQIDAQKQAYEDLVEEAFSKIASGIQRTIQLKINYLMNGLQQAKTEDEKWAWAEKIVEQTGCIDE